MNINILSIGKFKQNDNYEGLFLEYRKRINWKINIKELVLKKSSLNEEELKRREGELLLENRSKNAKLIVLDERGLIITTEAFAEKVLKYQDDNFDIDFIIGGAIGLSEEVKKQADFMLSFGKMVYPHMLVRVMLIEQIYRVFTIKNNIPYHKK